MTIGKIPDWHDTKNEACPQNQEGQLHKDCTCKKQVNRKGYRVCRVHDEITKDRSHKTSQDIVIEVHPLGRLVFREKGKRKRYETTAVRVLEGLRWRAAMISAQEARAKRGKGKGKGKKKGRR